MRTAPRERTAPLYAHLLGVESEPRDQLGAGRRRVLRFADDPDDLVHVPHGRQEALDEVQAGARLGLEAQRPALHHSAPEEQKDREREECAQTSKCTTGF
jgi:hypothetical protein